MARIAFAASLLGLLAGCSPTFSSPEPRQVIVVPQGSAVVCPGGYAPPCRWANAAWVISPRRHAAQPSGRSCASTARARTTPSALTGKPARCSAAAVQVLQVKPSV